MRKIGTISLNINTEDLNYGAILHSWAFQQVLNSYGIQNEIIDYITPHLEKYNRKYPTWNYIKEGKYYLGTMSLLRLISHAKRYEKFENFKQKHLKISPVSYTNKSLSTASLDYDTLVCESDVIWSPGFFNGGFDPAFFLALPSMKKMHKVAYAASMANANLSSEQIKLLNQLIHSLDVISVRETYAKRFIEQNCAVKATCVVDPVLLLSKCDYLPIVSKRIISEPYVLLYFPLGYSSKIIKIVKQYAKTRHVKLVELSRYPWDELLHHTILDAGVEDFLSLIYHADTVFSNSFHAVCFSLLFEKEFYAFSRTTGRKIEDICARVGVQERYLPDEFKIASPIDYTSINKRLKLLRKEGIDFIEHNIVEKCKK